MSSPISTLPMQAMVSNTVLNIQTPPVYNKDKRSNRRRVSCGFHHKRHQACPENCEGRVTHPPEPHTPFQDKFTVGCSECKAYFQNKVYLINQQQQQVSQQPQQQTQSQAFAYFNAAAAAANNANVIKNLTNMKKRIVIPEILESKPIVNLEQPQIFDNVSPISSSPASSRPISPISTGNSEVPTFKMNNMTKINLLTLSSKLDQDQYISAKDAASSLKKRKSPASPELLYSDDSGNSSPIAAFVPSPSQSPTITPRPVLISNASAALGSGVASTLVDSSLLMVLEQEAEKELFTQKEQELNNKIKQQKEDLEKLERQQQVIDYQKIQQQQEVKRLKRKHEELETLRLKLELMEKELKLKEDSFTRRLESLSPSNVFNIQSTPSSTQNTPNQLPKLHINTNLLKQATNDFDFSSSPSNSCNNVQPIKLSPLLLSSSALDKSSPIVPDTTNKLPMSFMHLLNSSQSS